MLDDYNKLREIGESAIRAFVDDNRQESITLEFKQKEDPNHGDFSRGDRQNYARVLSAFSNSNGGLLIWGVAANRNSDGVDQATECNPINEIGKFSASANSLAGELLSPINDQIEILKIECDEDNRKGYLAVLVPRSERRPHRAEAKGTKSYYKRSGDSNYEMEHFDIEDAFSRRSKPFLSLSLLFTVFNPIRKNVRYAEYQLFLRNDSMLSARFPYLNIEPKSRFQTRFSRTINPESERRIVYDSPWIRVRGRLDDVIHPGQDMYMGTLYIPIQPSHDNEWGDYNQQNRNSSASAKLEFGALDTPVLREVFSITPEKLQADLADEGFDYTNR